MKHAQTLSPPNFRFCDVSHAEAGDSSDVQTGGGNALCGYVLGSSSDDKGQAVLINMKPKTDSKRSGNVYSQDSGDSYYGRVDMKGPNALLVQAYALGRFYCSGNVWMRIDGKTERLISSRQTSTEPRS